MKKMPLILLLALQVVWAHQVDDARLGRNLAASCASCHGTAGRAASTGKEIVSLAGESREKLLGLLLAFKSGQKPSTVMRQIASGYTDQQLELIASWFASQKSHTRDQ